jgi:hypothetical protein
MSSSTFIAGVENFIKHEVAKEAKIKNQQLCTTTADNVVRLFVKEQNPNDLAIVYDRDFEQSPIIKKLLAQPDCKEHLVFGIHIKRDVHSFAIIKVNDGKECRFRLVHSFNGEFSLGMWLGLEDWNAKGVSGFCQKIYEKYNKPLTREEAKELLTMMIDEWRKNSYAFYCGYTSAIEIAAYEFNPKICDLIKTPEEQKQDREKSALRVKSLFAELLPKADESVEEKLFGNVLRL